MSIMLAQRLQMYKDGLTDEAIAQIQGVSSDAVSKWRRRRKWVANGRGANHKPGPNNGYRYALPPEQWARAESFMQLICKAKKYADKTGIQANIDLEDIRDIYQKEMAI